MEVLTKITAENIEDWKCIKFRRHTKLKYTFAVYANAILIT